MTVTPFQYYKYSNCLFYAVHMWFKYGGKIRVRKSDAGWFCHFLWQSPAKIIHQYVPIKDVIWTDHIRKPPFMFRGKHVICDEKVKAG